jgi:hypothetical protein
MISIAGATALLIGALFVTMFRCEARRFGRLSLNPLFTSLLEPLRRCYTFFLKEGEASTQPVRPYMIGTFCDGIEVVR